MRFIFVQDISNSGFSWSFTLGSGRKNLGTRSQGFLLVTWHSILSQAKFHSMQLCTTPTFDTGNNKTSLPSTPNEFTEALQPVVSCPALSFPTECCYSERVATAKQVDPKVGHTKDNQKPGGQPCHI